MPVLDIGNQMSPILSTTLAGANFQNLINFSLGQKGDPIEI